MHTSQVCLAAEPAIDNNAGQQSFLAEDVEKAPQLDFSNSRNVFKSRSTPGLLRSLLIFKLCQFRPLVAHADTLLSWGNTIFGHRIMEKIIEHTFYSQFVAGTDAKNIQPVLRYLRENGIHSILDYSAEDDVLAAHPDVDNTTVVSRTYPYESEAVCDRRTRVFLKSIEAAAMAGGKGFAAIKVTALGHPMLLERTTLCLQRIKELFRKFDVDGNGFVSRDEFSQVYKQLFADGADESQIALEYESLDQGHDETVDYLEWSKGFGLRKAANIVLRCKENGPMKQAVLTDEELTLLDAMMKRLDTLAESAAASGVRLMVDAEHSYFQPAIDHAVVQLQERFNQNVPIIFNTYQCYLKDASERLVLDLERAHQGNYKFAAKLVRGAYMVLERRRAEELGYESPILPTIEDTHESYNKAVETGLMAVVSQGAEIMVATHNQESVEFTVKKMAEFGLPADAPVYFGQLLGMADHITFTLGANGFGAYKYVAYGAIHEVVPYLIRRAQENSDVLGGSAKDVGLIAAELKRRLLWG